MGHYKSNLRDIEFNLFEVFGADRALGTGPFAQLDLDSAKDLLREVERLPPEHPPPPLPHPHRTALAASCPDADRNPPVFDPETSSVTVPASFKKSFSAYVEGGWDAFPLSAD